MNDEELLTHWKEGLNRAVTADGYLVQAYSERLRIGQIMPDPDGLGELMGQPFRVIGEATYEDAVRQARNEPHGEEVHLPPKGYFYYKTVTD